MRMRNLVFADRSGLVGNFLAADRHHAPARRELRRILRDGRRFLTTDYVFDEVVTRVRSMAEHREAVAVGERILSSAMIDIVDVEPADRHEAWRLFKKYDDPKLSFTDCASFAVMRRFGLTEAFTFDEDFRNAGFSILPPKR